jgi:hypothetical protein
MRNVIEKTLAPTGRQQKYIKRRPNQYQPHPPAKQTNQTNQTIQTIQTNQT